MEVHAPHHPISNLRDFFIHIATITIGLLIALALEAGVEALHHRHLRRETRAKLREEIEQNAKDFPKDLRALDGETQELRANIALLERLRQHQPALPNEQLKFNWFWNSTSNSAWTTAKDTGALSLMGSDTVEGYDELYSQGELVNQAALELSRSMTRAMIPLTVEPNLNKLPPALIDELIRSCAENLNQIAYVQMLAKSLLPSYQSALDRL